MTQNKTGITIRNGVAITDSNKSISLSKSIFRSLRTTTFDRDKNEIMKKATKKMQIYLRRYFYYGLKGILTVFMISKIYAPFMITVMNTKTSLE